MKSHWEKLGKEGMFGWIGLDGTLINWQKRISLCVHVFTRLRPPSAPPWCSSAFAVPPKQPPGLKPSKSRPRRALAMATPVGVGFPPTHHCLGPLHRRVFRPNAGTLSARMKRMDSPMKLPRITFFVSPIWSSRFVPHSRSIRPRMPK